MKCYSIILTGVPSIDLMHTEVKVLHTEYKQQTADLAGQRSDMNDNIPIMNIFICVT